jgi:hypothetical protein
LTSPNPNGAIVDVHFEKKEFTSFVEHAILFLFFTWKMTSHDNTENDHVPVENGTM